MDLCRSVGCWLPVCDEVSPEFERKHLDASFPAFFKRDDLSVETNNKKCVCSVVLV